MRPGWPIVVATMLAVTAAVPLLARDALHEWGWPSAYAARDGSDAADHTYRNNGNSNGNNSGDNSDDNDGDNIGDNGGDNDNSADFGTDLSLPPLPTRVPQPTCSRPGRNTDFSSYDGKVTVRVFGTSPFPVRVEILQVVNAYAAPSPPGTFVVPLVYEIRASDCSGVLLAEFPAEVNLSIRYTHLEATGLDEHLFEIGRLDMSTGTWVPVEKRANDPVSNVVAATITETGFYMVWEAR